MSTPRERGRRRSRSLRWALLGLVAVVAALYVAAYVFADERIPRGTKIEGVDVEGLTPQRAGKQFAQAMSERVGGPIEVAAGDRTLVLSPREVGLRVDAAASVRQVPVGASWNPMRLWELYTSSRRFQAVVVSGPLLEQRLTRLADQVERPPVRGGIEFQAQTPVPVYPRAGARLDTATARTAVLDAYAAGRQSVRVPTVRVPTELSSGAVDRAMSRFAVPAMSAPVTFTFQGERERLRPAEYASHITVQTRGSRLVPRVERAWLTRRLQGVLRRTDAAPRDATVRLVDGDPQIVPARRGLSVVTARTASEFLRMLTAERGSRISTLPTAASRPQVSTRTAARWRIERVVSSFTTYYPHAEYRNVNIGRAAQLVDDTVLAPGELFSLNRTVGERTRENGFARGFIISDGIFKEDYGGGVSQVATTVFNAAFFAGLEDVEHKPHSFYIDRYPVGREATVAWPTVDLRFRNDTRYGVLIQTIHTPSTPTSSGALTVRMWSTKTWDIKARTSSRYAFTEPDVRTLSGSDCVPNTGYEGFQVDVTRVFRRAGQARIDHTERMHATYIPSDTVICQ